MAIALTPGVNVEVWGFAPHSLGREVWEAAVVEDWPDRLGIGEPHLYFIRYPDGSSRVVHESILRAVADVSN